MNLKLLFSSQITCELYGKALIIQIHFTPSPSANGPTYPLSCVFNQYILPCTSVYFEAGLDPVRACNEPIISVGADLITSIGSPVWVALDFAERCL